MLVFKKIGGIELIVAEEFPDVAMELVGAGFDGGIEDGGAGAAKLRAEVGGLYFKFFDRVDRRKHDIVGAVEEIYGVRVVVDAIEEVVVLRRAKSIGGESAAGRIAAGVSLRSIDAGSQLGEKGKIASVQGKIIHAARVDDLAHGGVLRLEHRSGSRDLDGCCDVAG